MIKQMDFSQALLNIKNGVSCTRAGWNGRGMYVWLAEEVRYGGLGGGSLQLEPCLVLFTAQETHQPGWLPSQADLLADDWETVQ